MIRFKNFAIEFEKYLNCDTITEFSNSVPNYGHVDVFIYHVLPFRTWKSKNVRKILNRMSEVTLRLSESVFRQVVYRIRMKL